MSGRAAIIGGGVIGGGWAARFLLNGWNVNVYDPVPDAERKLREVLGNARRSLPGLYDVALPPEGEVQFSVSIRDAVADANWIQESTPERLETKHAVLSEIQASCQTDAIVASSTSGFMPTDLQAKSQQPSQIIVAHPFNPVYLIPLVELVGNHETVRRAQETLAALGMKPLHIRHEIEAHIADRLLEAVWREALWLVKDGIATTAEIDDAIRFGFGLRWAHMGLFETYRVAGGEAGMEHFIRQFGPALKWPWSKLTDVPDLDDDLIKAIASQSDAQSGHLSIRELERVRDDNLVAIMRALKGRNQAVGRLLNTLDLNNRQDLAPTITASRTVPIDWTDYNGHMNESRYGQLFSDAADRILDEIGAGPDYVASGFSFFTVDTHIKFKRETHAGDRVIVQSHLRDAGGKKLRLFHEMRNADCGETLATGEQILIHVDLTTRRACEPQATVRDRMTALAAEHRELSANDAFSQPSTDN